MNQTQEKALAFIIRHREENDMIPPSLREIAKHLKFSVGGVQEVIARLRKEGYLKKAKKGIPRAFVPTGKAIE